MPSIEHLLREIWFGNQRRLLGLPDLPCCTVALYLVDSLALYTIEELGDKPNFVLSRTVGKVIAPIINDNLEIIQI